SEPPPTDGLVGYWNLDEGIGTTANDISDNNNTGTLSGAVWSPGKIGQGLEFDGTDDYVDIGNSRENVKTISFWAKPDTVISQSILSLGVASGSMVDTGLVTRYYIDEASSGTSPTQVSDSSPNAYHLTNVDYGSGNMAYTEVSGNRGLESTSTAGTQRARRAIDNTSDVVVHTPPV
ncbi:MAG: hypothetical protein WA970_03875, partial [Gammaproteobacteria bacterium]